MKELKLVHIVYRHGIRTPADTYPKDPHVGNPLFPTGWGQITNEGKRNLYDHGVYLRRRYDTHLGHHYSPELYVVQTTDVDRTKVSAQCINAGLWPPVDAQRWGPLDWQPIPIRSQPLEADSLLLVRKPCPQYHLELERVINTDEIQNKLALCRSLFGQLSEHTGKRIETFEDVQDVYTTLMSEEACGLRLPQWTEAFYPDAMAEATAFSYVLNAYTPKLNRFKGGVFVKKLIEDWRGVLDGTTRAKAFLYVGHDATVVNVLSALSLWKPQIPNFSANIFFEFSYDDETGEHGVQIFFRNTIDAFAEPERLKVPGCEGFFCPLQKFVELTRDVVPNDLEKECQTNNPDYVVPPQRGP